MSGSSETLGRLAWSRQDVVRHADALPLIDDPLADDPATASFHRLHWISAAIAVGLFALARFDLLPAMPW